MREILNQHEWGVDDSTNRLHDVCLPHLQSYAFRFRDVWSRAMARFSIQKPQTPIHIIPKPAPIGKLTLLCPKPQAVESLAKSCIHPRFERQFLLRHNCTYGRSALLASSSRSLLSAASKPQHHQHHQHHTPSPNKKGSHPIAPPLRP